MNTNILMGQRPEADGSCPGSLLMVPCIYNNNLHYICDPSGYETPQQACSQSNVTISCPRMGSGRPRLCGSYNPIGGIEGLDYETYSLNITWQIILLLIVLYLMLFVSIGNFITRK